MSTAERARTAKWLLLVSHSAGSLWLCSWRNWPPYGARYIARPQISRYSLPCQIVANNGMVQVRTAERWMKGEHIADADNAEGVSVVIGRKVLQPKTMRRELA